MSKNNSTTDWVIDTWKLFILRDRLGHKAKQEPQFRFYSLYGHLYREDTLWEAWRRVRKNGGSPGLDGISLSLIEQSPLGVIGFLTSIKESLKSKTYKPSPVKRVYIDKPDGSKRPLGIPTIRDRVVQMACLLILEPIFEADFKNCSFGFRPNRSAIDALSEIREQVSQGATGILDADISGFFDNIEHAKLLEYLERRISDRRVLKLIRLWLRSPIVDVDRETGKKNFNYPKKGTPQGGVISPLLANIYLHELDCRLDGPDGKLNQFNAHLIRYADDFVIIARYIGFEIECLVTHIVENQLGLSLHKTKTRILNLDKPGSSFDFLGFTFRLDKDIHGRERKYTNMFPSKKSIERIKERIRSLTQTWNKNPVKSIISQVNKAIHDWAGYFNHGYPRMAFREVNRYVALRFARFLKRRSQRPTRCIADESWYHYIRRKGFVPL